MFTMPFVFRVYFCGHELSDPRYGKHTFQRVRSFYETTRRERSRSALRVIRLNRINDFIGPNNSQKKREKYLSNP